MSEKLTTIVFNFDGETPEIKYETNPKGSYETLEELKEATEKFEDMLENATELLELLEERIEDLENEIY
jgi:vacuolar-type H+-ATPase subunit D/Vma8